MENSRFKFKVWDKSKSVMNNYPQQMNMNENGLIVMDRFVWLQYTGLKDKNGVEIYEFMEIDNMFEVSFYNGCYILTNISTRDIIPLYKYIKEQNGKVEITREYTKI